MSESIALNDAAVLGRRDSADAAEAESQPPGRPLRARREVVTGGLVELWAHKLRSILTLTLLMLGVFALVVMISVLDGVQGQDRHRLCRHELGRHPDVDARRSRRPPRSRSASR